MKRTCVKLLAFTLLVAGSANASANLLANPGFENPNIPGGDLFGAVGWNVFGGGTFTIENAPHSGENAFKTFGAAANGAYQDFATTPGQAWQGGAWILNPSFDAMAGAQVAAVNIEWRDAGNNVLSFISSPGGLTAASPQGSTSADYRYAPVSGIAPLGATTARFVVLTGAFGGPGGGAPFFDDASFVRIPEPATAMLGGLAMTALVALRRRSASL